MSEIKGTLLSIVLAIIIFGATAAVIKSSFESVATGVGDKAQDAITASY